MRGLIVAVVLILLSTAPTYAQPDQTTPRSDVRSSLHRGAWYLSGFSSLTSFGFWANIDTADGDAEISVQSYNLNVAGGFFVVDHIAVGPTSRVEFTRAVDPADNVSTELEISLGVEGAYFWERAGASWVPVIRLAAAYERKATKDDTKIDDELQTGFSITPKVGVIYFFSERVAGGGEIVYSFIRRSAEDSDTTIVAHSLGLGVGVTVFFPAEKTTGGSW